MDKEFNFINELFNNCSSGSRLTYLGAMNKLYGFKPKLHKGIPQCQEVVQYRPQLHKLSTVLGPDNPAVMLQSIDPITDSRTLDNCRIKILADDLVELLISCHSKTFMNLADFEGDKMPVALCLGGNPIYSAVANTSLAPYLDPYFFAGLINCAAVKVVKCLTQELSVPDDCDIVIEGYVTKKALVNGAMPVMHVTGVTHRKGALEAYLKGKENGVSIDVGDLKSRESMESREGGAIALREKILLQVLKFTADRDITDIYLPSYGNGTDLVVIKIKKRYPYHALKVAHALWGCNQFMLNKVLLVVDESTADIRSNEQLSMTICSNYSPKTDTLFSRGPADATDKSTPVKSYGGKICMDATVKSSANQTAQTTMQTENSTVLSGSVKAIKFIYKGEELPLEPPVIVVVGKGTDINDTFACLHYVLKNADPIRDSTYVGNQLVIDIS